MDEGNIYSHQLNNCTYNNYGVKADLAFLQAMHETNWLKFTGAVKPGQNNFAGLGTAGGGNTSIVLLVSSVVFMFYFIRLSIANAKKS